MTRFAKFIAAALAPAFLLAACGDDEPAPPAEKTDNSAEGEIAGGTISDAMPPLEQLQSSAPPAISEGGSDADGEDNTAGTGDKPDSGGDADAASDNSGE